jgi:CHAT domain-containing protein
MFSKPIRYLLAIILAITIALLTHSPAIAAGPRSDCSAAATTLKLNSEVCDGEFGANYKSVLGKSGDSTQLRQLGVSLRRLGYLEEAGVALERSLQLKPTIDTRLSMANLNHAKYRQALSAIDISVESVPNLDALDRAKSTARQTIDEYLAIINADPARTQPSLNWLTLWGELKGDSELSQLQLQNLPTAKTLISRLNTQLESLPVAQKTEIRLKLADSLLKVLPLDRSFHSIALDNANLGLSESQKDNDLRSVSKAYGIVGKVNQHQGQSDIALDAFKRASSAAESIRAYDLLYQWQWETAKLYAAQGDREQAIKLYQQSIDCIEKVRDEMLSLKTDVQYSFRDSIEPVYREYIALLFRSAQPDLRKIVAVNEQLQIAELENYLRCGGLNLGSLLNLSPAQSPDASIYFVRLPNQYGILVRNKDGGLNHQIVDRKPVDALLSRVKTYFQGDRIAQVSQSSQFRETFASLYQQLIAPIAGSLPPSGHLTLSVDTDLQAIPWSLLFDGQNYLIEKYSLSLTPGANIQDPQPLAKRTSALVAGASNFPNSPSFSPLPAVESEINAISQELKAKTLINEQFQKDKLIRIAGSASILHLASHAQVSSDPQNTYVLGWNGKITLSQLEQLIKSRQNNPLELLILSACRTAAGDRRATLGIAGTAYQAGARSIVASLWVVNDESQAILMSEFYNHLINKGQSKGEALRQAQLKLLRSDRYSSPYYWANMVLLGSWL